MKEEFSLKDLTRALEEATQRVRESQEMTRRTGRITPDDLVGLQEIRTYDFYDPREEKPVFTSAAAKRNHDGTWEVRSMQGPDRDAMTTTEPQDVLGRRKSMEEAVALLEKFEADRAHLQRAVMRAIDLPHWSRVKAAMHLDKQRDIARRFPKP